MLETGKNYFIRTATYHWVGEVVSANADWVVLRNASWVADSGRWMQAIKEGTLSEVEPTGDVTISTRWVTDFTPWMFPLPTKQI